MPKPAPIAGTDTVRLVMASIGKSLLKSEECPFCRNASQKKHIHRDQLEQPFGESGKEDAHFYWQILPNLKTFYENILLEQMRKRWHAEGLEPLQEVCFKDGKYRFVAVSVCLAKGQIASANRYGLKAPKINIEKAKALMLKEAEKWSFTPMQSKDQGRSGDLSDTLAP